MLQKQKLFSKLIGTNTDVKTVEKNPKDTTAGSYDVQGHGQKCVERHWEVAHKTVDQLHVVSTLCLDDLQVMIEDLEMVGELSETCSHIVLKCL